MHDDEEPDHAADEPSSSERSDSESEGESSSSRSRPPSLRAKSKSKVTPLISKSRNPSAWTDPSDPPTVAISTAAPRLRKLRDAPDETILSGREYESRLRRQYERIHPQPEWAKKAKGRRQAATTASAASDEDEEEAGGMQDLLSSTTGILAVREKKRGGTVVLPAGTLAIERLRDANQAAQGSGSGEVKVVAFHPSDKIPVLCVGTADRRVRLFNVSILRSFEPLLPCISMHICAPSLSFFSRNTMTDTILFDLLGRWTHLPVAPNSLRPITPPNLSIQRLLPPPRFFSPSHRAASFLLHSRPPKWRHVKARTRTLGYDIQFHQRLHRAYKKTRTQRCRRRRRNGEERRGRGRGRRDGDNSV